MLTRQYVSLTDKRVRDLTGRESPGAVRGLVSRWNQRRPDAPIHRIHGGVDLLSLERAVLEMEKEHMVSCPTAGAGVSLHPCD